MVRNTECHTTAVKAPYTSSRLKGSLCSHTKFPPGHGGQIGNVYPVCTSSIMTVAIVAKSVAKLTRAITLCTRANVLSARGLTRRRRNMMNLMPPVRVQDNNSKELGPICLPESDCRITDEQRGRITRRYAVDADIRRKTQWGILVGPTCTRQCKACFGQDDVYAVRSPYPV